MSEVAACGYQKDLGTPCSVDGSHGEVEIEETDGSSSRLKEYDFSVFVYGSKWLVEVEEELSTFGYSVLGRRSLETGERTCRDSDVRDQ